MKKLLFVILATLFCSTAYCGEAPQYFIKANEAYQNSDFKQAIELYEAVAQEAKSGAVYYNLGNSYFRDGKIGIALANYLRARKYTPNNSDLEENIKYLRTLTEDNIENKGLFRYVSRVFFFYKYFNIKKLLLILLTLNVLFFALLTVMLYSNKELFKWMKYLVLLLMALSLTASVVNYKVFHHDKIGVVTSAEISVRSGKSINDTTLFNLHEGTEFRIIKESGDWIKILLSDKKKGWIQKSAAETV